MRYRCIRVFSLRRWACYIHTGLHVSRATQDKPKSCFCLKYEAITLYGVSFQTSFSTRTIFYSLSLQNAEMWIFHTPNFICLKIEIPPKVGLNLKTIWVWTLSRSLAATKEITTLSLFLRLLSCFSSPSSFYITYILQKQSFSNEWSTFYVTGFPHSDIPE